MKILVIAASLIFSAVAYGQGQFYFTNRDLANGVNARFMLVSDPVTISSVGTDYTINLTGGPAGGALVPLEPSIATFRGAAGTATAGYVNPMVVTVPGVAPGASADVGIAVQTPGGAIWETRYTINSLGGGVIVPPTIPLGANPIVLGVIPEPQTVALTVLGLGALLAIRRRK